MRLKDLSFDYRKTLKDSLSRAQAAQTQSARNARIMALANIFSPELMSEQFPDYWKKTQGGMLSGLAPVQQVGSSSNINYTQIPNNSSSSSTPKTGELDPVKMDQALKDKGVDVEKSYETLQKGPVGIGDSSVESLSQLSAAERATIGIQDTNISQDNEVRPMKAYQLAPTEASKLSDQEVMKRSGGNVREGTEGLQGKQELMKQTFDAFKKAGFSENQSKYLVAEVGRENSFNPNTVFGTHIDPANGAVNAGMFSWQGSRGKELQDYLSNKGLLDKNGKMIRSQASLDAMASFTKHEMETNPAYTKTKKEFLDNPNISNMDAANILGHNYIGWRIDDPKYRDSGLKNRADHLSQIEDITSKFPGLDPKSATPEKIAEARKSLVEKEMSDRVDKAKNLVYSKIVGDGKPSAELVKNAPDNKMVSSTDLSPVKPWTPEHRKGEGGYGGEFNYALSKAGREKLGNPGDDSNMTTTKIASGASLAANKKLTPQFVGFANELVSKGYKIDSIGGYTPRGKYLGGGQYASMSTNPSEHATGAAIDINPKSNSMDSGQTNLPPEVEKLAWKHGLSWGARFGDAMHFEAMNPEVWKSKLQQMGMSKKDVENYVSTYQDKGMEAAMALNVLPEQQTQPKPELVKQDQNNIQASTKEQNQISKQTKKETPNRDITPQNPNRGLGTEPLPPPKLTETNPKQSLVSDTPTPKSSALAEKYVKTGAPWETKVDWLKNSVEINSGGKIDIQDQLNNPNLKQDIMSAFAQDTHNAQRSAGIVKNVQQGGALGPSLQPGQIPELTKPESNPIPENPNQGLGPEPLPPPKVDSSTLEPQNPNQGITQSPQTNSSPLPSSGDTAQSSGVMTQTSVPQKQVPGDNSAVMSSSFGNVPVSPSAQRAYTKDSAPHGDLVSI